MMTQTLYPTIGSNVTYVRQNMNNAAETGSGIVLGFGLDANKRLTAHLNTGQEKINVNVSCLNPSEEFITSFVAALKAVTVISDEGNAKVKEIVAAYNKRVDDVLMVVLGQPLEFEEKKEAEKEIEPAENVS